MRQYTSPIMDEIRKNIIPELQTPFLRDTCTNITQHLTSYPFISEPLSNAKSTSVGQSTVQLASRAYNSFARPVIPYLSGPLSVLAPYVSRADTLADHGLNRLDRTFPAVKTADTRTVLTTPFRLAGQGRDYVLHTYEDERRKTVGAGKQDKGGVVLLGKAVLSTELKIAVDAVSVLTDFLGPKKDEAKRVFNEKLNNQQK